MLGEFAGVRSPATVHTPIVGRRDHALPRLAGALPLRADWEHALMLVEGDAAVAEHPLERNGLLYLGDSRDEVEVSSDEGALLFLLGGEPFEATS